MTTAQRIDLPLSDGRAFHDKIQWQGRLIMAAFCSLTDRVSAGISLFESRRCGRNEGLLLKGSASRSKVPGKRGINLDEDGKGAGDSRLLSHRVNLPGAPPGCPCRLHFASDEGRLRFGSLFGFDATPEILEMNPPSLRIIDVGPRRLSPGPNPWCVLGVAFTNSKSAHNHSGFGVAIPRIVRFVTIETRLQSDTWIRLKRSTQELREK